MKKGFTIIELLVVISVLSILGVLGFAAYRDFQARQELTTAVKTIENDLLFTRQKAFSGEKPSECIGTLVGWRVDFQEEDSYQIIAHCTSSNTTIKTVAIGPGVTKTAGPPSVTFKILAKGTTEDSDVVITFTQGVTGKTAMITITKAGLISLATEPAVTPTPPSILPPSPTPTPTCTNGYRDLDKDGYGAGVLGCYAASPDYNVVQNSSDCYDANANANPGQINYFNINRGDQKFDYNCDGVESLDPTLNCTAIFGGCGNAGTKRSGFNPAPPDCGMSASYFEMFRYSDSCGSVNATISNCSYSGTLWDEPTSVGSRPMSCR